MSYVLRYALRTVATLSALLVAVPVAKASAEFDGYREWATSNGAQWSSELEEAAKSVSRGGVAQPLPEGSVAPWSRGVFGYATLPDALNALGDPPAAETLVAAHAWFSNGAWGVGYVSVVRIEKITVPPTTQPTPKPTRPTEPETGIEDGVERVADDEVVGTGSETTVPAVEKDVDVKVEATYTTADEARNEAKAYNTPVLVAGERTTPNRSSASMWLLLPMGVAVFVAFRSRQSK